jgi:hypothetical protein
VNDVSAGAYRDPLLSIEDGTLTIRRYGFPLTDRRIRLGEVRAATDRPIGRWSGQWRLWGSGDLTHWWNLDVGRRRKSRAFELDTGSRVRPMVTPDDPDAFADALRAAGVAVRETDRPLRFA